MICEKNRRDSLCLSAMHERDIFFHYEPERRKNEEKAMSTRDKRRRRMKKEKEKVEEEEAKKLSSFIENWKDARTSECVCRKLGAKLARPFFIALVCSCFRVYLISFFSSANH
jgi:uncharacterized protein YcbK (DUF882 family)